MAKISYLISKASNLWKYFEEETFNKKETPEDGQILFSKNNVCVHHPFSASMKGSNSSNDTEQHFPGYLVIRAHRCYEEESDQLKEYSSLILSWIPNGVLKKNPKSVEHSPCKSLVATSPTPSPGRTNIRNSRRHSLQSLNSGIFINDNEDNQVNPHDVSAALSVALMKKSQDDTDEPKNGASHCQDSLSHLNTPSELSSLESKRNCPIKYGCEEQGLYLSTKSSHSPTVRTTSGSGKETPNTPAPTPNSPQDYYGRQFLCENSSPVRIFTVDLKDMKSLRLFFSSQKNSTSNGQLVVASRESQYKVFHFHHGGLDKLVNVLEEWDFLKPKKVQRTKGAISLNCKQFYVCKPQLRDDECHPEEGVCGPLDETVWAEYMNALGQIEDDFGLRKIIFFGGVTPAIRKVVWPFLLHRFVYDSTSEMRKQSIISQRIEYEELNCKRENMDEAEKLSFWKSVQCTVEKDVPRTDRSNPFFAGENNQNIEIMMRILLNYAVLNPPMGYTQGMSDLLAPLLMEVQDESETFWCFVGLMENTLFVCSPRDIDMNSNLILLRELIRIMVPTFYNHLKSLPDALELLFSHRWILLCLKREFPDSEVFRMWKCCWSHYQTDYFHLFLCVAIISIYGQEIVSQNMKSDEILFHFSTLTMHMDGDLILRKARGLLHEYRQLQKIPCTLEKLCHLCGSGMWDSLHEPSVDCVQNVLTSEELKFITCQCKSSVNCE